MLGLGWTIGKTKADFVGKRSLARPDLVARGRKQLVGLLTADGATKLEEGAQIVDDPDQPLPMRMIGHVTSCYHSAALGRSIALAVVENGRDRMGETVHVPMPEGNVAATIAPGGVLRSRRWPGEAVTEDRPMKQVHQFDTAAADLPVIEELPPGARFSLRARPAARAGLAAALGFDLPGRIGDRAREGAREVLCLGPDEWMITAGEDEAAAIPAAFAERYAAIPHALADISDREVSLAIRGPGTLALLAMGCPRDVARIAPGRGARTIFHGATVVLWRDAEDAVRIDVWRSFMPHLRALLETGLAELRAGL